MTRTADPRAATAPASFTVRALERTDFSQWLGLWAGYNAFYGRAGPTALAPEITAATWDRFYSSTEPMQASVAEHGGRLLGLVHYLYHRSTIHLAPVCYLQDLFTAPEARGQGVAAALIQSVYQAARAADTQRVYWHTHETNATARRLYDRLAERSGFIVYRTEV
jgi:GNAT superfamily N-acetyltransferase